MIKKKIAIIGAGNAAVATACHYHYFGVYAQDLFDKITIYYDPSIPIERVGQGTSLPFCKMVYKLFGLNWYDNNFIKATPKNGILYEHWGKNTDEIFHQFPMTSQAFHFVPKLLSKLILESGLFNVVEKRITNPEEEIDADFIFDCRGKHNRELDLYEDLINPLNHVILARKNEPDLKLTYTRCVATPDGWTFVIPNHDSVSYGYLFNDTITSLSDAKNNFVSLFDVVPDIDFHFDNYIAKNCFYGERTIFNGNRLSFLEPLEATSIGFYLAAARCSWDHIVNDVSKEECNQNVRDEMLRLQTFVQWHYQFGSKYNTPFWDYAKSLPFNPDEKFTEVLNVAKQNDLMSCRNIEDISYSQWSLQSVKLWEQNI
jgi:tryptophan halogenase